MEHDRRPHFDPDRSFFVGIVLNSGFIAAEIVVGLLSGSMALIADAGHNLSDVLGLALAWAAFRLMRRPPSRRRTYGWGKLSVFAALVNAIALLAVMGGVAWESLRRFADPPAIASAAVFWTAVAGVLVNSASALLFRRGQKNDLNLRAAFLHLLADAGVSATVALAAAVIRRSGWLWLDPLLSLLIVVAICIGTIRLLRDSFNLAVDAVPGHIDVDRVQDYFRRLPGVEAVHDLHIWALSTHAAALTVHLVTASAEVDNRRIEAAQRELAERFGIRHVTIQWEHGQELPACGACRGDS